MILCLVGMSGVGKSFWAARLSARGFSHHDCDADIWQRLADIAPPAPGEPPVQAVGRWMGMPWSPGYESRQARYLELEEEVTRAALMRAQKEPGDHVIDTTGSVVYTSAALQSDLRAHCRVVYLAIDAARRAALLKRYLDEPKPVVWGRAFAPRPGESPTAALPHCYADLLELRDARYRALAHVQLDAGELEATSPPVDEFIKRCS